jgi:hypothetical protein
LAEEGVIVIALEVEIVTDEVAVQLFAEVTDTLYVPAANPVRFCEVIPAPQLKL